MLAREDCLAHALDCEDLAAQLKVYGGGVGMMRAAAIWRNLAERILNFQHDTPVEPHINALAPSEQPQPKRRTA